MLPETQAHQALRAAILKTFFYAAAAAGFIACLNYLLRPPALPPGALALLLGAYAALGMGSLAATRLNGRQGQRAMQVVQRIGIALVLERGEIAEHADAAVGGLGLRLAQAPGLPGPEQTIAPGSGRGDVTGITGHGPDPLP